MKLHELKKEDAVMMNGKTEELMAEALDLDELDNVTGGTGSGDEASLDGTVVERLPNGMFSVDIGGQTITAHISGKLRMNYIRIMPRDRVRVEGTRITYVYR